MLQIVWQYVENSNANNGWCQTCEFVYKTQNLLHCLNAIVRPISSLSSLNVYVIVRQDISVMNILSTNLKIQLRRYSRGYPRCCTLRKIAFSPLTEKAISVPIFFVQKFKCSDLLVIVPRLNAYNFYCSLAVEHC